MVLLIFQGETLVLTSNESQLRIYNSFNCGVAMSSSLIGNFSVEPLDVLRINYSSAVFNETDDLSIYVNPMCQLLKTGTLKQRVFIVKGRVRVIIYFLILSNSLTNSYIIFILIKVSSYLLTFKNNDDIELKLLNEPRKLRSGNSNLRLDH